MIKIILTIIMIIESNNNPLAYNPKTKARGLCQITPICLKDYNQYHSIKYSPDDLFNPKINREIANWYINKRIPEMLKYYKIPDTIKNRLIAYNWGIGNLKKWYSKGALYKDLPKETKEYVRKYFKLLRRLKK